MSAARERRARGRTGGGAMTVTPLALDTIAVAAGTQVRSAINEDVVADYAERLAEGVTFPPVVVFRDGSQSYLADGFHRVLASRREGREVIKAEVRPGTKTDALWYALGANRANGLRLTLADKQHAIRLALETWPEKSAVQLSTQIGCTDAYVGRIRAEVHTSMNLPDRVIGKDGKSYPSTRRSTSPHTKETPVDAATTPASAHSRRPAAVAARRERIRTMAADGHSLPQIAAAVGMTPHSVANAASRYQIDIPAQRVMGRQQAIDSNRIVSTLVFDDYGGVMTTTTRTARIRPIAIATMRVPKAGTAQRPFSKAHGDTLAAQLDLEKLGYPVINLANGVPWILDGQHRIYALRQNGFGNDELDCEVYESLSEREMADRFLGRNNAKAVNAFDRFQVAVTAGHRREVAIAHLVDGAGLKISTSGESGYIRAVTALIHVYEQHGATGLSQTLRTIRDAYDGDPAAFAQPVIEGIGLVYGRYNGQADEAALIAALARMKQGVHGLFRRAQLQRERTGKGQPQCVAAAVVDTVNRGTRGKTRLPGWWTAS